MHEPLTLGPNHDSETPKNNGEITERDEKGRFVKGSTRPVNAGRKPGSLNFATKWRLFIEKVAEQNGIQPEDIDNQLLMVGFKQMEAGNYSFWKDIQDRVHGSALAKIEHSGELKTPGSITATPEMIAVVDDFNKRMREAIAAPHMGPKKQ